MTDDELNALYPNRAAQIRAGNVIEASRAGDRQRESDRRKAGPWYKNTAGFDNPATWASLALLGGATVPAMFSAGGAGGAAGSGGSAAAMTQQISPYSLGMGAATDIANIGYDPNPIGRVSDVMSGNGNPLWQAAKTLGGGVINAAKNLPWGDVAQTATEGLFNRWGATSAWKRQQEAFNKELYLRRQQMEIERGMNRRQWLIDRPTYQTRNFARAELGGGIGMDPATQQVASAYEVDPARIDEKVGTIGQMYNL